MVTVQVLLPWRETAVEGEELTHEMARPGCGRMSGYLFWFLTK